MRLALTEEEYRELLGLEYVLIWRYTEDYELDFCRYEELLKKNYRKVNKRHS